MTPTEAAAAIDALVLVPRTVRLRQAFDQAAHMVVLDDAGDIPPDAWVEAVDVATSPRIPFVINSRMWNDLARPKRTAKRKAQRRARRITRLHRR